MDTRKNATKTSTKAKINLPSIDLKSQKKIKKDLDKEIKTLSIKSFIVAIFCLLLGVAIGCGIFYAISKDDCFALIGSDEIELTLDEEYNEQGVKIIEFGRDISDQVIIETNMELIDNKSSEVGTFYVKYSVESIKFGKIFKIEKIRLVTFVEASEGEVYEEE